MAGKTAGWGISIVDVGAKRITLRKAVARALVRLNPATVRRIMEGRIPKGDVLVAAQMAGIMAAKHTPDIVPLCHPVRLTHVALKLTPVDAGFQITASVAARERTGVEMEALAAVSAAALTVYDMCKAVDRGAVITDICVVEKQGGRGGVYVRKEC